MGTPLSTGQKRYAPPTTITLTLHVSSLYISDDNPAELEKRFRDSKVNLTALVHLPNGMPPLSASRDTTIANVSAMIDTLLQDVSRLGVEIDEGV